jgi:hypothetical protein
VGEREKSPGRPTARSKVTFTPLSTALTPELVWAAEPEPPPKRRAPVSRPRKMVRTTLPSTKAKSAMPISGLVSWSGPRLMVLVELAEAAEAALRTTVSELARLEAAATPPETAEVEKELAT